MRKIVLLLPFLFVFCNCSTDDSINSQEEDLLLLSAREREEGFIAKATTASACFTNFTATVSVDVSGGFGNPVLVFTPQPSGAVYPTEKYSAKVEIQPLSDCDDMSSNSGNVLIFSATRSAQIQFSSPPVIRILPSGLPQCYKWRYVSQGHTTGCVSSSPWYETPVY